MVHREIFSSSNMNSNTKTDYGATGWRKTMTKLTKRVKGSKQTKKAKGETNVTSQAVPDKHLKCFTTETSKAEYLHNRRIMPMSYYNGPYYYNEYDAFTYPGFQRLEDRWENHEQYSYHDYSQQNSFQYHSYEPPARFFPQAPPPPSNAKAGEPDFCTIV